MDGFVGDEDLLESEKGEEEMGQDTLMAGALMAMEMVERVHSAHNTYSLNFAHLVVIFRFKILVNIVSTVMIDYRGCLT